MLSSLFLVSSLLAPAPQEGSIDFATMRRDLEVMRRILTREIFGPKDAASPRVGALRAVTALGFHRADAFGRSEAFFLPGDGALFLLTVPYPLAGPTADEDLAEPSLWDRVQAEVEGRSLPSAPAGDAYEAEKVEALKDQILEALATYGLKIGQLSPRDHLTVVVSGSGGAAAPGTYNLSVAEEGFKLKLEPSSTRPWVAISAGSSTVLVLRIAVADLRAAGTNGVDPATLRSMARIVQY